MFEMLQFKMEKNVLALVSLSCSNYDLQSLQQLLPKGSK